MCGESMRLETHERLERIPGTAQATKQVVEEWICPECDYFEEADEDPPGK